MSGGRLTHFDETGAAAMVDVAAKPETQRMAEAKGVVRMAPATLATIRAGDAAKGDVLGVARLAGIMGAKRTADLIPLCHPLALSKVAVSFELRDAAPGADGADGAAEVEITATASLVGRTGVEMEALTAVTTAALTIYDMCKAADKGMRIEAVRLTRKEGGRSGVYEAP